VVNLEAVGREGDATGADILFIGQLIIVIMERIEYNMVCQEIKDRLGAGDSRSWDDIVCCVRSTQCMLYLAYTVLAVYTVLSACCTHSVCCTRCMLYSWYMPYSVYAVHAVDAVLGVCCTRCMLYSVYAVLGVCCTRCIL